MFSGYVSQGAILQSLFTAICRYQETGMIAALFGFSGLLSKEYTFPPHVLFCVVCMLQVKEYELITTASTAASKVSSPHFGPAQDMRLHIIYSTSSFIVIPLFMGCSFLAEVLNMNFAL